MASSSTRIPLFLFLLLPSALIANEGIFAFNECGLESGRSCYDKPGALRLKLITSPSSSPAWLASTFPLSPTRSPFVVLTATPSCSSRPSRWWRTPTNKITNKDTSGIPHHLLGGVPPDADFTASNFCRTAGRMVDPIAQRRRLLVVAGGLNLCIEELIEGARREFGLRYECYFLWVDVELKELCQYVAELVDLTVERGLVEEVRRVFNPEVGYFGSF